VALAVSAGAAGQYRYNPEATEDAARELTSFLARHLKS
jgi:dienelactone hydrolase